MNYSEEELKAIEDVKRELTDEDRREYMSSWFAKDLEIILNLIEKQQKRMKELEDRELWATSSIYGLKKDFIPRQIIIEGKEELQKNFKKFSEGIVNKEQDKAFLEVKIAYEAMIGFIDAILERK